MAQFDQKHIKNVALLGHSGSGKTTLAETMLYEAGILKRRGNVEDKNTVSDYNELEHERGNSIFSSLMHADWRGYKINLIDTPGYDDFVGDVVSALKVADTGVMLLNAQFGVEVGTELIWDYTEQFKTPMIFAVNQLDHEKADFDSTVEQAKSRFGNKVTVVQYPLNQGNGFNAIIDLLKMTMYQFPPDGGKPEKLAIPDSEKEKADRLHNELIEACAENDENLMELYFDKGNLDEDEMRQGLKIGMVNHDIFPLFCLSAKRNMGSGRLMGFIDNVCPSATEMPAKELENGQKLECKSSGDPVLFIFKTISEPHLGEMSFFKIYSGTVKTGDDLVNEQTSSSERINQLFTLQGKSRSPVESLEAGDIGVTVKLKETHTNNTLHLKGKDITIPPIEFPEPRIRTAVVSNRQGDEEKLSTALHHLKEEDPTLRIEQSQELSQTIIHAQGELHLNVIKWKLENLYKLDITFDKPKIPFRETIKRSINTNYRHKKQSGGAGQFAEIHMRIEPYYDGMPNPQDLTVRKKDVVELDWGGTLALYNCIVGGAIDNKFFGAIMKGLMEKMQNGPLTGSYCRDIRVCVYDGKMHPVDSNDMAFKIATMMAFKNGFREADPEIMEPIYEIEVLVPDDIMGDVIGDLQTRRGIILGMDADGHYQKIKAKVPLMELYKYSSSLRSLSQGRAKHTRTFSEYAAVPYDLQQKLIGEHKEEAELV